MEEGAVIKLGRVCYRVSELRMYQPGYSPNAETRQNSEEEAETPDEVRDSEVACRICYSEYEDDENPLLSLCKCAGTLKYIHLMCLRNWLGAKMTYKDNEVGVTYLLTTLECELCKTPLPNMISHKD